MGKDIFKTRGHRDIDIDLDIDDIGHYRYRHRYWVTVNIDIDIVKDLIAFFEELQVCSKQKA